MTSTKTVRKVLVHEATYIFYRTIAFLKKKKHASLTVNTEIYNCSNPLLEEKEYLHLPSYSHSSRLCPLPFVLLPFHSSLINPCLTCSSHSLGPHPLPLPLVFLPFYKQAQIYFLPLSFLPPSSLPPFSSLVLYIAFLPLFSLSKVSILRDLPSGKKNSPIISSPDYG